MKPYNDAIPQPPQVPRGPDLDFGSNFTAHREPTGMRAQVSLDGQITASPVQGGSYNAGLSQVDSTQPDAWKETGRNSYGAPVGQLCLDTTVEIDGVRTDIKAFIAAGMLEQLQDGSFARPGARSTDTLPGPEEAANGSPVGASGITEADEDTMSAAFADVHPSIIEGAMHRAADFATRADFSEASLNDVARQIAATGQMDLGTAQEQVRAVHGIFEADMRRAVLSTGVDPADFEGFVKFVRGGHQGELREATQAQLFNRDVAGYRRLAERFLRDVRPAEVPGSHRSWDGKKDLVVINGMEMTVEIATKLGLIR